MARGARARGLRVVAVTSLAQSPSEDAEPAVGRRLVDEADLVIDLCTPARRRADRDRRGGHTGRARVDDRGGRGRQLHQGPHRPAPRGAGRAAADHHPSLGRRRRTLAGIVRCRIRGARATDRSTHRREGRGARGSSGGGGTDRSHRPLPHGGSVNPTTSQVGPSIAGGGARMTMASTPKRLMGFAAIAILAAACSSPARRQPHRVRRRQARRQRRGELGRAVGGRQAVQDRLFERRRRRQRLPRGAGLHRQGRGDVLRPGRPSSP